MKRTMLKDLRVLDLEKIPDLFELTDRLSNIRKLHRELLFFIEDYLELVARYLNHQKRDEKDIQSTVINYPPELAAYIDYEWEAAKMIPRKELMDMFLEAKGMYSKKPANIRQLMNKDRRDLTMSSSSRVSP